MQEAKIAKNSPSAHHRTTLSGCIFATKACIDNRKKKLAKQQYLLHMCSYIVNFGPLTAEISSGVWGTPANFNGFHGSVTAWHSSSGHQPNCGVEQTAPPIYSAGRPSHWTLAHFLVCNQMPCKSNKSSVTHLLLAHEPVVSVR